MPAKAIAEPPSSTLTVGQACKVEWKERKCVQLYDATVLAVDKIHVQVCMQLKIIRDIIVDVSVIHECRLRVHTFDSFTTLCIFYPNIRDIHWQVLEW